MKIKYVFELIKNYKSFIENTKFITNDATRTFDVNKYQITDRVNATGNDYVVTSVSSLNAKQYLDTLKNNEPVFTIANKEVTFSELTASDITTITSDTYSSLVYNQYLKSNHSILLLFLVFVNNILFLLCKVLLDF